jgi:hypothetical protein
MRASVADWVLVLAVAAVVVGVALLIRAVTGTHLAAVVSVGLGVAAGVGSSWAVRLRRRRTGSERSST